MKLASTAIPLGLFLHSGMEHMVIKGWTKCYPRLSDVGLMAYLCHLIMYLTFLEFATYWAHRIHHDIGIIYKYVHRSHHLYRKEDTLTPFAGRKMVEFKCKKTDKKEYLVTVGNADDAVDSGVQHNVLCPMTGSFAERWPSMLYPSLDNWCREHEENSSGTKFPEIVLRSSHHKDMVDMPSFPTLRARLTSGEVKWNVNPRFGFEFSHIPNYWEWLEDILRNCRGFLRGVHLLEAVYASLFLYRRNTHLMESFCEHWCTKTNTLVTASGEVSISLWDIRCITGLPVTGLFYDEVVPSLSELLHSDKEGKPHLPPCCRYLFIAFHRIISRTRGKVKVTFEDWCRFWFRGPCIYSSSGKDPRLPTPKKDFSCYGKAQVWDDSVHSVFQTLDIPETDRRQTYLAAFLSCWLCAFVLPVRDLGYIRVTVFKVASLLASGQTISLAIPVLASIYRGLNDISTSVSPGRNSAHFAAHYVYAWLASYYRSHKVVDQGLAGALMISFRGPDSILPLDARDVKGFIYSGRKIDWRCTSLGGSKDEKHNDDPRLSRQSGEFFMAMRSCFLTLRHEDNHVIEPYSPHRFGRQFGFFQDVPGELECDVRGGSRERMFQFFESSVRLGTKSKFIIPRNDPSGGPRVSTSYDAWWKRITSKLFCIKTLNPRTPVDDHIEKSLLAGEKRKSEHVVTSSSGKISVTEDSQTKRPMKFKIRPSVEPLPSPNKDLHSSKNRPVRYDKDFIPTASRVPSSAQISEGKLVEESILGIFEDDVPETDDPTYVSTLKDDMNIETELAASNLSSFDTFDQDLIDAINDPVIFEATASLMINEMADKDGPTAAEKSSLDVQDVIHCEEGADKAFKYAATKSVDVSTLQTQVKKYLSLGLELQSVRRSFLAKPSVSSYEKQISNIKEKLSAVNSLEKQARDEAEIIRGSLRTIASKKEQLVQELAELGVEETRLTASLTVSEDGSSEHVAVGNDLSSKQSSLEGSLAAANEELKKLQGIEKAFVEEQAILRDLAWSS
ncbi:hypothetical protein KSS87_007077 [Heliosperma pusillum]|nr:hypothetical protein KSS87_007077 [Heliosperma pusillum]